MQPTMPSKTLLQGKPYVPSHKTDIRETFRKVLEQSEKPIKGAQQ